MDATDRIAGLIEPSLRAMGFELVRLILHGSQRPTLQVMAERLDRTPMTVDHCAEISRALSALLDVEDPIPGAYRLEVTSPGIDRPLVRRADFERFAGFEARLETHEAIAGRKRFRGRLLGLDDDQVRIGMETGEERIAFENIKKAKLVLSEELLAAARAEQGS